MCGVNVFLVGLVHSPARCLGTAQLKTDTVYNVFILAYKIIYILYVSLIKTTRCIYICKIFIEFVTILCVFVIIYRYIKITILFTPVMLIYSKIKQ